MSKWTQQLFRWYVRRPDHPAKLRLVRMLSPWFAPTKGVLCDVDDGVRMWLNPDDDIEGALYRGKDYEPHTLEFLRRNLNSGRVAVFAGANSGLHMLLAAKLVGETGIVVGIEPQPGSLWRALRNVHESQPRANVLLVSGGLGAGEAILPMAEHKPNHAGWASFVLRSPVKYPYQIQVLRYDALIQRLRLPPVDLMLLDVEGYELEVFRGMSPETAPAILLAEVHDTVLRMTETTHQQYFDAITSLGYDTWTMDGTPAKPGSSILDNNLVCVKKGCSAPNWLRLNPE